MKVSTLLPVYNGAATVGATIESVLRQNAPPDEILVMDDGSIDATPSILESFNAQIRVYRQPNGGVARARNELCRRADGDLIAFLDADDLWHPGYLALQRQLFEAYPEAAAFFTGHVNFFGYGSYQWNGNSKLSLEGIEVMDPSAFNKLYNQTTGMFASMSYCCLPRKVLREAGDQPFEASLRGAEDHFLFNLLPLLGRSFVYVPAPAVAYRVTDGSLSADLLKMRECATRSFEALKERYEKKAEPELLRTFKMASSSEKRGYAKVLLGAGRTEEARRQLRRSLKDSSAPVSVAKSLVTLLLTYLPEPLRPRWPAINRVVKDTDGKFGESSRIP